MSRKKGRDTIKAFFHEGAMPTSSDFSDLIDSTLNMVDDGFEKSDEQGLQITNIGEHLALTSFFHSRTPEQPQWHIRFDGENSANKNLVFGQNASVNNEQDDSSPQSGQLRYAFNLTKYEEGTRIGVGVEKPEESLHVLGNIQADGRRGKKGKILLKEELPEDYESSIDVRPNVQQAKDGHWTVIGGPYEGPVALEVVARITNGKQGTDRRESLIHAIALHTGGKLKRDIWHFLGRRNEIKTSHSFLESYFLHRLQLKWHHANDGRYYLKLKARCRYGEGSEIDHHVTSLYSEE